MRVAAARFIRSAAGPADFPADGFPEIALVGRSNVGKSRLINALVGEEVARTSAAPGKTRLVNLYRIEPGAGASVFYLADLPGYGHAGGGAEAAREFEELTRAYFEDQGSGARSQEPEVRSQKSEVRSRDAGRRGPGKREGRGRRAIGGVLLAIDSRHPGLASDLAAFRWLATRQVPLHIVATKADKLSQAERARSRRELETRYGVAALPVSAATGEGLEQLWKILLTWIGHK